MQGETPIFKRIVLSVMSPVSCNYGLLQSLSNNLHLLIYAAITSLASSQLCRPIKQMSRQKCLGLKRQSASEGFIMKPITNKYLHRMISQILLGRREIFACGCRRQNSKQEELRQICIFQAHLLIKLHRQFNQRLINSLAQAKGTQVPPEEKNEKEKGNGQILSCTIQLHHIDIWLLRRQKRLQ